LTLIMGILSINGPFDIAMLNRQRLMEATNGGGDPRSPTELALAVGQRSEVDKRQKKLQNTGKSVENHWKISRFTDFLLGRRQISGNRQLKQKRLISGFSYSTSLAVILFKTKLKKNATFVPSKSDKTILCGKFDMKTQQIRFAHHPIPGIATGQLRK